MEGFYRKKTEARELFFLKKGIIIGPGHLLGVGIEHKGRFLSCRKTWAATWALGATKGGWADPSLLSMGDADSPHDVT